MSINARAMQPVTVTPTLSWSPRPHARHALNGPTMGTRFSAVFTTREGFDTHPIAVTLQAAVDAVDQQMSNWQPQTDVSRFNASAHGLWLKVAANTIEVIETGLEIGRRSGGAFDIGMGAAVDAWGFGPGGLQSNQKTTCKAAPVETATHIDIDRRNARLRRTANVHLDLCGIAKGFGVDELARVLESFGITDYLVSIDGEVRGSGVRLDGKPWQVAIEKPDTGERSIGAVVSLRNCAIATSGDYRHRRVVDGRTVSHTIDPRTGDPLDNALTSVSVMAANCMLADAWATALLVAGPIAGPSMAEANGLDALFIVRHENQLLELTIGSFE